MAKKIIIERRTKGPDQVTSQMPVSRKPRKPFRPAKPFLALLYLETERSIPLKYLARRGPLHIKNMWIKQRCNHKVDNVINWINHYPADNNYPLDSDLSFVYFGPEYLSIWVSGNFVILKVACIFHWDNSKKLWIHTSAARVPTAFLVLPKNR